ncbi:hypothetical protein C8J57DRAFT_1717847 [Mycena rebaudengoi]|nr:hypothetical protein C8J57DRAFT_1717847 [Mycena rebaudengoi]
MTPVELQASAEAALKLYEEAAWKERRVMRETLFPGRQFRSETSSVNMGPPPFVSPASGPELKRLPTDPAMIADPEKTLVPVITTGIIGSLTSDQRNERRVEDARYCARHFGGHVVVSSLDFVLARLGSSLLVNKLAELKKIARKNLDDPFRQDVLKKYQAEALPSADRMINGRFWLSRLADAAQEPSDPSPLALDYFPSPNERLPIHKKLGYTKNRKYDASLHPAAAGASIFNIFLNIEFTQTPPPGIDTNPLIGATAPVAKYQQAIINTVDLLTFQPTRLFVPTLSFHGAGEQAQLFVSILSPERLDFAVVQDCFAPTNFPTVSALLHLFRVSSMYQLGYNPLFDYSFTSPPPDFSIGDAVPASPLLPGTQGIVCLNGNRLSRLRSTPFTRSTVVLEGDLYDYLGSQNSVPVVVKMSSIDEARLWREKIIVDALYATDLQPPPAYAPKLLAAFAAYGSPPLSDTSNIIQGKRTQGALPPLVSRHLEVMVYSSPHGARKLENASAAEFLSAAEQLFRAILDAFRRRILHRDIFVNNILIAGHQLLLIDWELGRRFQEPASTAGLAGTLDSMSVASLEKADPLPHDDIESAVYVLLKLLTQTFVPPQDQQHRWSEILGAYHWDDPDVGLGTLQTVRIALWTTCNMQYSTVRKTTELFRSVGDTGRAQLVNSLLSLPLPTNRQEVNSSDYNAVLLSLQGLVEQAVAAVHSVDVSSLLWSSAGEVDE